MKNNVEKAIDNFIGVTDNQEETDIQQTNAKKVVLDEREGLIERIDRVLVTKDGKQLLREQY